MNKWLMLFIVLALQTTPFAANPTKHALALNDHSATDTTGTDNSGDSDMDTTTEGTGTDNAGGSAMDTTPTENTGTDNAGGSDMDTTTINTGSEND